MNEQGFKDIVQSTAKVWPNDQRVRELLAFPLSLTIHPLQPLESPTIASFPPQSPNDYRCNSCKAFLNYLCVVKNKNQYNCSICGCTNHLNAQINSLQNQMISNAYTCITTNPAHFSRPNNLRTFIFILDLNIYIEQSKVFLNYAINVIKKFIKEISSRQSNDNTSKYGSNSQNVQMAIFGFTKHIHQYRLVTNTKNQSTDHPQPQQEDCQFQIYKQINTHLTNQYIISPLDSPNYFLQLPKHQAQALQILDDIISVISNQQPLHKKSAIPPINQQQATTSSNPFISALDKTIALTSKCVGKIFIVSGINCPPSSFINIQQQHQDLKDNFNYNRKKCLPDHLSVLIDKTQMAVSFFIYNNSFVNNMPLLAIAKITNGELKHYVPHCSQQFFYQFNYAVCIESLQLGTEAVLKVRHSNGVRLVGIFGQYRWSKGTNHQIQLLTCPLTRCYVFEFNIEGFVHQPNINIQFSILYTNANNNREFKIITHSQKVSGNKEQILNSVNYGTINQAYLWAVLYNMDQSVKIRNLQITLQQRCKKHIEAIKCYTNSELIKKATSYIIFTFFLIRHFIMNNRYSRTQTYDKAIQTRSRLITDSTISGIHGIWPITYSINENEYKIIEMKYQQIKKTNVAIIIDSGNYCYVYITNQQLRNQVIKRSNTQNKLFMEIAQQCKGLAIFVELWKQIQQEKLCGYVQTIQLASLQGVCVLDQKGPQSYTNFINTLLS